MSMRTCNFFYGIEQRTLEGLMQIRNACSTRTLTKSDEGVNVLERRMAMLDLGLCAIQSDHSKAYQEVKRRCMSCIFREACALDLKRDPYNPVWESYCPNSAALFGFTEAWWPTR